MDTVLLVDDDKMLRHMLKESLEREDFIVLEAAIGKRSIDILERHRVDLIVLDLRLPDGSGLDFMCDIRALTDVPLMIVSGERDLATRIKGFEGGADDYIDKPFNMDELIARIKANLRRYHKDVFHQTMKAIADDKSDQVSFADWVLDRTKFQILNKAGEEGGLALREFQLLDLLISKAGQALNRDELCEAIRENNYIPTPRAIDVKITRIRKKIGDSAADPRLIKTVRGVGYMFDQGALTL